jgi:hypothetical protein
LIERFVPFRVVKRGEATRRRRRAADDMHDDVDAAKTLADRIGDGGASFRGGYIGDDKMTDVRGS